MRGSQCCSGQGSGEWQWLRMGGTEVGNYPPLGWRACLPCGCPLLPRLGWLYGTKLALSPHSAPQERLTRRLPGQTWASHDLHTQFALPPATPAQSCHLQGELLGALFSSVPISSTAPWWHWFFCAVQGLPHCSVDRCSAYPGVSIPKVRATDLYLTWLGNP